MFPNVSPPALETGISENVNVSVIKSDKRMDIKTFMDDDLRSRNANFYEGMFLFATFGLATSVKFGTIQTDLLRGYINASLLWVSFNK